MEEYSRKIESNKVISNKTKKLWEKVFTTRKLPHSQYPIRKIYGYGLAEGKFCFIDSHLQ